MKPNSSSRIMVRPAIRCSRCIHISDTKQRAAATIGAMLRRQVASKELFISNLAAAKRLCLFAAAHCKRMFHSGIRNSNLTGRRKKADP
ncbi:MAG: hypothetical protein WCL14_08610 [Bacteroidota bacterium]